MTKTKLKSWIGEWYHIILITLLGTALRINLAVTRGSLVFDDIFSIHFSNLPLGAAIKFWLMETNPPLHFIILRFFLYFFDPRNELLVRSLSIFFGVAGILAIYLSTKKILNKNAAIFSSLILTLSSVHTIESTTVRTYTLLTLLSIISMHLTAKIISGSTNRKTVICLALTNALFLNSHLTALPIFLIEMLAIFFFVPQQQKKKILLIQGISVLLFLPWLIPAVLSKLTANVAGGWYFSTGSGSGGNIISLLLAGFFAFNLPLHTTMAILCLIFLLFHALNTYKSNPKKNIIFFYLLCAIFPPISSSLLSVSVPKYLLASFPALFMVLGYSLSTLANDTKKMVLIISAIYLLMFYPSLDLSQTKLFSWPEVLAQTKKYEKTNTIMLISYPESLPIKWYYTGSLPMYNMYVRKDNFGEDERYVRYNWSKQNTTVKELSEWMNKLAETTKAEKIIFVDNAGNYDMLYKALMKNKWQVYQIENKAETDFFEVKLYEFIPNTNNQNLIAK